MVGPASSDRRLLWHPRQSNTFILGSGSYITLYEWNNSFPQIKHVTTQPDLQYMKCFAWSPDPILNDLVAVGFSNGRVDLLRLEASRQLRMNNVLSSGPPVPLPAKNSRSCNSLAFGTVDPNYLAVGLDKVRGDSSLLIYDITMSTVSLSLPTPPASDKILPLSPKSPTSPRRPQPSIFRAEAGARTDSRIVQQHAPTETVSAVSFLPQSTYLLLAGLSSRWLRLFDLRSAMPSTTSAASKVSGLATDPFDPHRVASFGDGVVSIWDIRRIQSPLLTFSERNALGDGAVVRPNSTYSTVEFSQARRGVIATLEKDARTVRSWDIQEVQAQPLDVDGSESKSRDSSVGSRRKSSWANLGWAQSTGPSSPAGPHSVTGNASVFLSDTRRIKQLPRPLHSFVIVPEAATSLKPTSTILTVNATGEIELNMIYDTPKQAVWSARGDLAFGAGISYGLIPGSVEQEQLSKTDAASISKQTVDDNAPPPALFGRGDEDGFPALGHESKVGHENNKYGPETKEKETASAEKRPIERPPLRYTPSELRVYSTEHNQYVNAQGQDAQATREARQRSDSEPPTRMQEQARIRKIRHQRVSGVSSVVQNDVSMLMRTRSLRGYGLSDPALNARLITETSSHDNQESSRVLADLWSWLSYTRDLLKGPAAQFHGYDFLYRGLLAIWEGFEPNAARTPYVPPGAPDFLDLPSMHDHGRRRAHSPVDDPRVAYKEALTAVLTLKGPSWASWKPTIPTGKLLQRQVAIMLCGWSLQDDILAEDIQRWTENGENSRAACWLVFSKQYSKAINMLFNSEDESHHLMSGTLAALIPHNHSGVSKLTPEFRQHCEHLTLRIQDPYFRAMLTYLTSGDWSEVLDEEMLPFRERLSIAFQFLDDKTLTSYLHRVSDKFGDIDALMVTGLTKAGVNVLQDYVDRTGDLQTAALLGSYVCPRRFEDQQVERWIETYRDLLDAFKLFHLRVGFDIERGEIMQEGMHNGEISKTDWAPKQLALRCNYCNKNISGQAASKVSFSSN
uniref:MIOS-like alpha-solenoid domain-containing protein n=1 Tax=Schizophyllum commune (strain H4-8 / FGSC 9210) TaxID=578458 RepID=D8PQ50_SCHCM